MKLKDKFNGIISDIGNEVGKLKTYAEKKQFCENYEITMETLDDIISRHSYWTDQIRTDENIWKSWKNSKGIVDYSTDIEKSKIDVNNAYYRFRAGITDIAIKRFSKEINPEEIEPEDLEDLTKDEPDGLSNELRERIFKIGLEKFASGITPEQMNADVLEYLYINGFEGKIENPTTSLMYKMYVEGKEKDKTIFNLQTRVKKQEDLIKFDTVLIQQLYDKAKRLQNYLQNTTQIVSDLVKSIRGIDDTLEKSEMYLKEDESKNVFKIMIERIKKAFSKQPPRLTAGNWLATARDNCRISDEKAVKGIQETRDDGLGQVENGISKRNSLQRDIYTRETPSVPITKFSLDDVVRNSVGEKTKSEKQQGLRGTGTGFHEVR